MYKYIDWGDEKHIDNELQSVIKELNNVGLITTQCCSGHKKELAYISINMEYIEDVAIRENGKRLVIWWKLGDCNECI
jgi:hypothetical protein